MFCPILSELDSEVDRLLERHLASSREWFPHQLIPWERGNSSIADEAWHPGLHSPVPEGVRSAIFVNLLTEDNLPYYTRALGTAFGDSGPWREWMCRWTAEEGRHSIVIRDWVTVSRILDPIALERGRMRQVSGGVAPDPWSAPATLVYVTLQELATRVAHFNTARAVDDPAGYEIMKRVAADENLHFLFYRDLTEAAIAVDPSAMMTVLAEVVCAFAMPGTGIDGFGRHAAAISAAGIYSLPVFYNQVLAPTLAFWRIDAIEGLDADASHARDRLLRHAGRVERISIRSEQQRQES